MKTTCPNHDDHNASLHVYADGCFCFVCQYACSHESLGLIGEDIQRVKKDKEDIEESIAYIRSLPQREIRGCAVPYDGRGFYIVWPKGNYYKCRTSNPNCRYVGPTGHRTPLYTLGTGTKAVVLVEGEFNGLSLYQSLGQAQRDLITVSSPGSCNEFQRHVEEILTLGGVFHIVVDKDKPGVIAGLKLKEELLRRNKRVELHAVEKDFNDMLVKEGKDSLVEWVSTKLYE